MSGRTIGAVVGAAIGFAVAGPAGVQLGFLIGSVAGGLIDPETMQGAQFQGGQVGGSQSGLAIPIVFATNTVESRLLDGESEPRLSTRTESAGKGGPEVEHDVALLSYSLEICESSELRETSIHHVLACWEDEQLVFDVRPGSQLSGADNAKFMANKTFAYGREDQLPNAMLEAIHGIGNVPAYRGLLTVHIVDEDLMVRLDGKPRGGRIPPRRWLVSACAAEPAPVENRILVTGVPKTEGGPMYATATSEMPPTFFGIEQSTGATTTGLPNYAGGVWLVVGTAAADVKFSLTDRQTWIPGTRPATSVNNGLVGSTAGWLTYNHDTSLVGNGLWNTDSTPPDFEVTGESAWHISFAGGYYWRSTPNTLWRAVTPNGPWTEHCNGTAYDIYDWIDIVEWGGDLYATAIKDNVYFITKSTTGGASWGPRIVEALTAGDGRPYYLCPAGDDLVCWAISGGIWTSANGWSALINPGITGSPNSAGLAPWIVEGGRKIAFAGGLVYVIGANVGVIADGDKCVVSATGGLTWSDPITMPIGDAIGIAASDGAIPEPEYTGTPIPDAEGYFIDRVTGVTQGPNLTDTTSGCTLSLAEVVRRIYNIAAPQLGEDHFDLSALEDDVVRGYKVQDLGLTAADAIEPLRRVFTFDLPEYDQKIRARKRGGDVDWVIDVNDIVVGEDNTLDDRRGAPLEYPRTVRVHYLSPVLDYKPTEQVSPDVSPDFEGVGEENVNTYLVLTDDEAAQAADIIHKVMMMEREHEQTFSLPIPYIGMTAADVLTVQGKRLRVDAMRIERNRVVVERAVYDRPHAYSSTHTGRAGTAPPAAGGNLHGPTDAVLWNAPVLDDNYDRPGIIWAARGYPNTRWIGARLQVQRGAAWETLGDITVACNIGELLADLPIADKWTVDEVNTLSVRLPESMDSISQEAWLSEGNGMAVMKADGTAEILQARYMVEGDPDEYAGTMLIRGGLDTEPAAHVTGARVVELNSNLRFVELQPSDMGKTLTFRVISLGTNPDSAPTQTLTITTMESQREWAPHYIEVEENSSGGYCISWAGRPRLGNDMYPQQSQYFAGYSVRVSIGAVFHDIETEEESVCLSGTEMEDIFGAGYGAPTATVVAKSSSPQDNFNGAAPDGWVALSGTWIEDPPGTYILLADGANQGRMYREALYAFSSGTFEASVEAIGPVLAGFAGMTIDFIDAGGNTFLTEQVAESFTVTAAELAPFGTVANARVYLRALSSQPFPGPVTFNFTVTVTP